MDNLNNQNRMSSRNLRSTNLEAEFSVTSQRTNISVLTDITNSNNNDNNNNSSSNSSSNNRSGGKSIMAQIKDGFSDLGVQINTAITNGMRNSAFNLKYGEMEQANISLKRKVDEMERSLSLMDEKLTKILKLQEDHNRSSLLHEDSSSQNGATNITLVEKDVTANNNINCWIRNAIQQLKQDGLAWNFDENESILHEDNQKFVNMIKQYVKNEISLDVSRPSIGEGYTGYISDASLYEKIKRKFNNEKADNNTSEEKKNKRNYAAKLRNRRLKKLSNRTKAYEEMEEEMNERYGIECVLLLHLDYMSDEEDDTDSSQLPNDNSLPKVVVRPPTYRTTEATNFYKDLNNKDLEIRPNANREALYCRIGEPVDVTLSATRRAELPAWAYHQL